MSVEAILKRLEQKGYFPMTVAGGIVTSHQGAVLKDFHMWTRKLYEYEDGTKQIRTAQVIELKEAALHYWRDGWVPTKPIEEDLLRLFENELRNHGGLKREGYNFSDSSFLEMPAEIPAEYALPGAEINSPLKGQPTEEQLEGIRASRTPNPGA